MSEIESLLRAYVEADSDSDRERAISELRWTTLGLRFVVGLTIGECTFGELPLGIVLEFQNESHTQIRWGGLDKGWTRVLDGSQYGESPHAYDSNDGVHGSLIVRSIERPQ